MRTSGAVGARSPISRGCACQKIGSFAEYGTSGDVPAAQGVQEVAAVAMSVPEPGTQCTESQNP